jgi:RNA-binding protein YhbY
VEVRGHTFILYKQHKKWKPLYEASWSYCKKSQEDKQSW